MDLQYNWNNPAVKRIMRESQELCQPTDMYHAQPLDDNLFEWHFTVRGPADTPFDGGLYHGRIILPTEYPMKPPNFVLLTPNGRFEVGKKVCLSISGHHPELWQPSWSIRTALLALISFMPSQSQGAIGGLEYTPAERRQLARRSLQWQCDVCGPVTSHLLPAPSASAPTAVATDTASATAATDTTTATAAADTTTTAAAADTTTAAAATTTSDNNLHHRSAPPPPPEPSDASDNGKCVTVPANAAAAPADLNIHSCSSHTSTDPLDSTVQSFSTGTEHIPVLSAAAAGGGGGTAAAAAVAGGGGGATAAGGGGATATGGGGGAAAAAAAGGGGGGAAAAAAAGGGGATAAGGGGVGGGGGAAAGVGGGGGNSATCDNVDHSQSGLMAAGEDNSICASAASLSADSAASRQVRSGSTACETDSTDTTAAATVGSGGGGAGSVRRRTSDSFWTSDLVIVALLVVLVSLLYHRLTKDTRASLEPW